MSAETAPGSYLTSLQMAAYEPKPSAAKRLRTEAQAKEQQEAEDRTEADRKAAAVSDDAKAEAAKAETPPSLWAKMGTKFENASPFTQTIMTTALGTGLQFGLQEAVSLFSHPSQKGGGGSDTSSSSANALPSQADIEAAKYAQVNAMAQQSLASINHQSSVDLANA